MFLGIWGRWWWLQLLRLPIFGFCVWIGVVCLLLLQPHVSVKASFQQQFLVPLMEKEVTQRIIEGLMFRALHTYRPRSAIRPSLITRIWSAPMMVDNLFYMNAQLINVRVTVFFLFSKIKQHTYSVNTIYLWATTTVVRLAQTLAREAWMLRSVCVSSADVAWRETECYTDLDWNARQKSWYRLYLQQYERTARSLWVCNLTSSSKMICGALRMVLAIATLCFSPPLSFRPLSPTCVSYPARTNQKW